MALQRDIVAKFLCNYGAVATTPINNVYTEFSVSFGLSAEQKEMNDRQLTCSATIRAIRKEIIDELSAANLRRGTVLALIRVDRGGRKNGTLILQAKCQ
jgi:hypothetical protein